MTRRAVYGLVGLVAVLALTGCSHPSAEKAAVPPTVAVARIARGDVAETVSVAAEFRPFQEIDVHAKVAGYLKTIYVDVGDRVHAGQLLAVLEVPELEDEMRQDQAGIKRAEEEIKRSQAELERAQSLAEVAHLGASRLSGVIKAKPNLVAQQDVDEATGRDRAAEAQVATAQAALAAASEQLVMATANASRTKTLFGYTQITAPFAGVITHRYADTGAMIQAGTSSQTQAMPLVKLSENTRLRLVIPVPESAASLVRLGASVTLTVPSLDRTVVGTVARSADRIDSDTRTMPVEVDIKNEDLSLTPGMYADVSLVLADATNVLVAPLEALNRSERSADVMVVAAGGHLEARTVTIGLEASDRVQILSGLAEGDLVVIGSRSQLKTGAVVLPKILPISTASESAR